VTDSQTRPKAYAKRFWAILLLMPVILSLSGGGEGEVLFINADVVTMNPSQPRAEALLLRGDRIVAVGREKQLIGQVTSAVRVVDLAGRTLAPGFVDAHSHFPVSGLVSIGLNVAPPPTGVGSSTEAVLREVANRVPSEPAKGGEPFIIGFNYDNTAFANPAHPTRVQIDAVSNGYPVYLWHNSGHLGVANSVALERLNITEETEIPGGELGRDIEGRLNGLLFEKAAPSLRVLLQQVPWVDLPPIAKAARDEYTHAGITTLQNGYASVAMQRLLLGAHAIGLLPQQPVVWLAHDKLSHEQRAVLPPRSTVKIIVDGSPQGLTAYLTEPFNVLATGADNKGLPIYTTQYLSGLVLHYHRQGHQLALHGNGDAAIDQIIAAVDAAQQAVPRPDARHILVHAQLLRADQVDHISRVGLTPSFFTTHTYFWGDWHRKTLGERRAEGLSPAASAQRKDVRFTLHTDTPVTPMQPLMLIWAATERRTRSNYLLGASERIGRMSAWRAITLDAAWQSFLEDEIGSLEPGKRADLVVLSENPLQALDVRRVSVEQTWIGGNRVYKRSASPGYSSIPQSHF